MEKGYLFCITENGQVSWISHHETAEGATKAMADYQVNDEDCKFVIETTAFIQRIDPAE